MNIWHDIDGSRVTKDDFICVIEIPKGGKMKYELDKETGLMRLDRVLYTSTVYPTSYGFIPHTYAEDGDPLDVLVLCSEPVAPMTLVRSYPVGVIKMVDDEQQDEKIIAIPFGDPMYNVYRDVSALPAHISEEMAHFFEVYKTLEHKKTTVHKVDGRAEASSIISRCIEEYGRRFPQ